MYFLALKKWNKWDILVNNGITQSHRIGLESCAGQPLEVGWKVGGGTSGKEQKACKTNKQEKKGIIDFEAYSGLDPQH
jgi:hypothetical protein